MKGDLKLDILDRDCNDDYYDEDLYKIKSWGADITFREIVTMYSEGELVKPEIQRNYVWDKTEASRFIDSILLGLPVPSIFLANDGENNKIIIDGYQRIMTVHDYINGKWTGDNTIFKLSKSAKINTRWAGKAFVELDPKEQKKIKSTTIHAIIFEQIHPKESDTSLYQIFERINTSGRTLNPQEIRNCIYQGELNTLLINLNVDPKWRGLFGTSQPDSRMRDIEFILRFFAILSIAKDGITTERVIMKKFLNLFMGNKANSNDESLAKFKDIFERTMTSIDSCLGRYAFYRTKTSGFNPTIFDSIAVSFALRIAEGYTPSGELTSEKNKLFEDADYIEYISKRTTDIASIKGRILKAKFYFFENEK